MDSEMRRLKTGTAKTRAPKADLLALARAEPLTERVAGTIRHAILTGQLTPGTRLSVPDLARRLGVSRTPAREALLVLQRDGLIGARGTSGMEVLVGDQQGLLELLEVREAMEGLAARLAAERMADADRVRLAKLIDLHLAALEEHDLDRHVELDAKFHGLLREGAQNARLGDMLERIEHQVVLINRTLSDSVGFEPRALKKDHKAIADAISAHDPDRAEAAMRKHVRRMRDFLLSKPRKNAAA
jgi:DNA-binding GntR family transcriptional regulator